MLVNNTTETKVRQIAVTATITSAEDATQTAAFTNRDSIKSFEITRVGDTSKFFGFGVTHRLNLKLVNVANPALIKAHNKVKLIPNIDTYPSTVATAFDVFPTFYISEVHYNETEFEYSITAYDVIPEATELKSREMSIPSSYSIGQVADAAAALLGVTSVHTETIFSTLTYDSTTKANLEGTESIREVLDAIAEATQTIYYINHEDKLVFKRLDYAGTAVATIDKDNYFELKSRDNKRLGTIASVTELGDNYSASTAVSGSTQYVRNNPFWELRDDIATLVDNALAAVGGATISQFEMNWRGNLALEIGDKINITTLDADTLSAFLLDDSLVYDGGLKQKTQWIYKEQEETDTNPTNLGDALKQTYAKVNKVDKEVTIVASKTDTMGSDMAALKMNTDSISASVTAISDDLHKTADSINNQIGELQTKVNAAITAEDVRLEVEEALADGVNEVRTTTGFVFNDKGLTISKTGSEMETNIDEDGMTITRNNTTVLEADNQGVSAYNLHASTYLIVGENSRFEDYTGDSGEARTGCFWIAG